MPKIIQINLRKVTIILSIMVATFTVMGVFAAVIVSNISVSKDIEFNTFGSCQQLAERFSNHPEIYPTTRWIDDVQIVESPPTGSASETKYQGASANYSRTNIQVTGVDEADIVKTDGKYVYILAAGSYSVEIISNEKDLSSNSSVSEIIMPSASGVPTGMFVNGDKLVIFTDNYRYYDFPVSSVYAIPPYWQRSRANTQILVYDITDRSNPKLSRNLVFDGSYKSARMIGDNVYVIAQYYPVYSGTVDATAAELLLPYISEKSGDYELMADCNQVSFYGKEGNNFALVVGINLNDNTKKTTKVLMGGSEEVYMSQNNLYLNTMVYDYGDYISDSGCDFFGQMMGTCGMNRVIVPDFSPKVTTQIFKLNVDGMHIQFVAAGEVPGTLLNQFSMDEHSGYFRVATTSTSEGRFGTSQNNMYVLDENMHQVGKIEGLAEGERIYAVRFMGDRAYVVTFRQVDPLFVIDLSQPNSPKNLGELKVTGFSVYLHPYDENHLIGFGHDATEGGITKGLKIALFDVSNPAKPVINSHITLGGQGSYSEILSDHKSLLFDREKGLIVIPVTLYKQGNNSYSSGFEFGGFVVMNINLTDGISEKGRISMTDSNYYYPTHARSLFIDEKLYTIDQNLLKVADLRSLKNLGKLKLEGSSPIIKY